MRWLLLALAACLDNRELSSNQDPFCPAGWKRDFSQPGECAPPLGYTALAYAEIGGSGAYGFVRSAPQFQACSATPGAYCPTHFVGNADLVAYRDSDVTETSIHPDAHPLITVGINGAGVYKVRLDPGEYRLTGTDPVDGTRFWSGHLTVVSQSLAACVIDVYPP